MSCPKCNANSFVKNGFVKDRQRHRCKNCGCQYTRPDSRGRPFAQKLLAVTLYAHGLSLNALAKLFGISTPGMLDWVRTYARQHYEKPTPTSKVLMLELDEMWHYLQKKQQSSGSGKCWIVLQESFLNGNVVIEAPQL